MNRFSRYSSVLLLSFALAHAALGADTAAGAPARLRFEPRFILEAVARQMNVTLRPEIPVPQVLLESTTPLRRFQNAMTAQWGFRPPVFANAYAVTRNEIYLMDDARYYSRLGRTLDDSLAHEFAHYIQVRYLNADLANDSYEIDAVAVQQHFKEQHTAPLTLSIASTERR